MHHVRMGIKMSSEETIENMEKEAKTCVLCKKHPPRCTLHDWKGRNKMITTPMTK